MRIPKSWAFFFTLLSVDSQVWGEGLWMDGMKDVRYVEFCRQDGLQYKTLNCLLFLYV
jgi:hypothetical protein